MYFHSLLFLIFSLIANSILAERKVSNSGCDDLCASFSEEDCAAKTAGQCYYSDGRCLLDTCFGDGGGLIVDDIFRFWSNTISIGHGLNLGTILGVGGAQEFDGIFAGGYGITNPTQEILAEFITLESTKRVLVVVPADCIIEVWDLETMRVISTNYDHPGYGLVFTAEPFHRYGGYAWYSTNAKGRLRIEAYDACTECNPPFPSDYLDVGNINAASNLVGDTSGIYIRGSGFELGRGGTYYTTPPFGREFNGIFATPFGIVDETPHVAKVLTTALNMRVLVVVPPDCIIEVWNLETMRVISTNYGSPGKALVFTALPNIRYGGFVWYSTNAKAELLLKAYDACSECTPPYPAEYLDNQNIDADSHLVPPNYCKFRVKEEEEPFECGSSCSSVSVTCPDCDETLYLCVAPANGFDVCSLFVDDAICSIEAPPPPSTPSGSCSIRTPFMLWLLLAAIWLGLLV